MSPSARVLPLTIDRCRLRRHFVYYGSCLSTSRPLNFFLGFGVIWAFRFDPQVCATA